MRRAGAVITILPNVADCRIGKQAFPLGAVRPGSTLPPRSTVPPDRRTIGFGNFHNRFNM
jgi:hypothetical protein